MMLWKEVDIAYYKVLYWITEEKHGEPQSEEPIPSVGRGVNPWPCFVEVFLIRSCTGLWRM
jgi:hypothetical protein